MQEDSVHEPDHRRDLVGDGLGGVVVPGVHADHEVLARRIGEVELVRADGERLEAEPEELALHRVAMDLAGQGSRQHLVERLDEASPRAEAIVRQVLAAVGDPDVHHRRRAERLEYEQHFVLLDQLPGLLARRRIASVIPGLHSTTGWHRSAAVRQGGVLALRV